jgi:hypothetical protein
MLIVIEESAHLFCPHQPQKFGWKKKKQDREQLFGLLVSKGGNEFS